MQQRTTDLANEQRHVAEPAPRIIRVSLTLGAVGLVAGALTAMGDEEHAGRLYHAYLTNFAFFLSLSLGALFFVILQHLTRSGWSVVVRRLAECVAGNLLLLALLAVPILVGMHHLYHWTDAEAVAQDHLLHGKAVWLNTPFFIGRVVVYFLVWSLLARYFYRRSVRQDETGDVGLTLQMQRFSAPAMLLYAVTVTFAAFDLLMSLDPHWYSTIFGVYYFAGGVVGFFALLSLIAYLVQRSGRLTHAITAEHYQDLGKLVFAFVVFWAYIAFSQYMLIWYANIPEETGWFLRRQNPPWAGVGLTLLFGHFLIPFVLLIARGPKRRPAVLAMVSLWVLIMHWLDIYWLVVPQVSPDKAGVTLVDILCLLGIGGLFVAALVRRMSRQSLIPERDPRLAESRMFENV